MDKSGEAQSMRSIVVAAAIGSGKGSSTEGAGGFSRGGGALRSPRFSSNHLSMSSDLPTNGRLPRRVIISSLYYDQNINHCSEELERDIPSYNLLVKKKLCNLLHILTMGGQQLACPFIRIAAR